ncbi:uncharacterized protein LOC122870288 isoform X2 [Siniperca chuatsi]|uniref:uncharacterized protein LOC122870288 isoform X2 n=1 Tax=Siniperca chuatsi TaxID=119488 RepID=UPI001CE11387|nr:uncharacterized protein LOC122870288 isoform X2 [Siniperca chuatsi]
MYTVCACVCVVKRDFAPAAGSRRSAVAPPPSRAAAASHQSVSTNWENWEFPVTLPLRGSGATQLLPLQSYIMKSSSSSSTSETAGRETQLLSSSLSPPLRQSLQSPELQAEFLQECRNKFPSRGESRVVSSPSPSSSPRSPSSSSSSPSHDNRRARLSLSSPELLSELKESSQRQLRHVPEHNGLTTVFSGRGRGQASGPAPSPRPANQKTSQ